MRPAPENGELRQRDLTERERKTRRKNKKKSKIAKVFTVQASFWTAEGTKNILQTLLQTLIDVKR